MKITLAMPFEGHQPDETITVDEPTGRDLIRCGWARTPDPAPPKAPKPAKAADADPAT